MLSPPGREHGSNGRCEEAKPQAPAASSIALAIAIERGGRLYEIRHNANFDERDQFMAAKTVNVGLIGTKFMGKAHSNAYMTVAKFFDVEPQPVMKAICGRHADETAEFAKRFGWESHESDWKKIVRAEGYRRRRYRVAGRHASRHRGGRGEGGKACVLREAAGVQFEGCPRDARRGPQGGRRSHGEFQLPRRAGARAGEADDQGGRDWRDSPLPRDVFAGLAQRPEVPDELAAAEGRGRLRRERRPQCASRRYGAVPGGRHWRKSSA